MNGLEFLQEYAVYLIIPLVSGLVGYGTNWLAVKMMMGLLNSPVLAPWAGRA